jgi:NAD(P)-dependent dehydrogenase (short-subunit alcohol dehydrogenase family)
VKSNNPAPVLITGASNGIGYATALLLCTQGIRVIALSRNEAGLKRLKEEAGENLLAIPFNLNSGDYNSLLQQLQMEGIGSLHGIIHNAGHLISKTFEKLTDEDIRDVYDTNVFAPIRLTRLLLPLLKNATPSHVVMISSMGGVQGSVKFPGLSAYSSSKGALCTLTECLALEYQDSGVSFNCLALGAVQTEMLSKAFPGYNAPMQPADMAGFVAWFVSEGQKFFNGKILPVAVSTP